LTFRPPSAEDGQSGLADCSRGVEPLLQAALIERAHPLARTVVFDGPQAHDDGPCSGDLKGAPKTEDAFTSFNLSQTGIAR
jgi:hypothetical protein